MGNSVQFVQFLQHVGCICIAICLYNIQNHSDRTSASHILSASSLGSFPILRECHAPGSTRIDSRTHGAGKLNSLPQGLQPRKVSRTSSQDKHPRFHWRELLEADSASRRVPNSRAKNSTPCVTSNHRRSVNTWSSRALVLLLYFSSATSDARSSYASMT